MPRAAAVAWLRDTKLLPLRFAVGVLETKSLSACLLDLLSLCRCNLLTGGVHVQKPDAFEVAADLPGVSRDDIKLHVEGDVLSLAVEKKSDKQVCTG